MLGVRAGSDAGWVCGLEQGSSCVRGWAAGRSPTAARAAVTSLHRSWFVGQTSPGMPVQREAGAGKISRFLQGRSDLLALLIAYKSFDIRAI